MKFRTQCYERENDVQSFSYKTDLYKLNEVSGELEKVGEQDDFELIQSSADCALDKVLERFGFVPEEYLNIALPQKAFIDEDGQVQSMFEAATAKRNAEVDLLAERLRDTYGTISYEEIVKQVKERLESEKAQSQQQQNKTKGGDLNENSNDGQKE